MPPRIDRLIAFSAAVATAVCLLVPPRGAAADDPATKIMAGVETRMRAESRLFAMDIHLTLPKGRQGTRHAAGILRADPDMTRVLYIFTAPRQYEGASLLIHDFADPAATDRIWVHYPGLGTFREVKGQSLRLLIPGTGLTYEDARGWISTDTNEFRMLVEGADEVAVEGRPRDERTARDLRTSKFHVRVDRRRHAVTGVAYYDLDEKLTRTYEAHEFAVHGDAHYPARVETHHRTQYINAQIDFRYRFLDEPPPEALFVPSIDETAFLDRFLSWLGRESVGEDFLND